MLYFGPRLLALMPKLRCYLASHQTKPYENNVTTTEGGLLQSQARKTESSDKMSDFYEFLNFEETYFR